MEPQATPAPDYAFKTEPFRHQGFEGVLRHWDRRGWGYLLEMGAGKSKIFIDNACILYERGEIELMLVIAPKGVYRNWVNKEIPAHMPDRIRSEARIHLWRGGHTVTERREMERLLEDGPGLRVFVVNREAVVASMNVGRWLDRLLDKFPAIGGVDESSTIKNPEANGTLAIRRIGRRLAYRRIMTGTPVTRSPLDLWAQFEFLQPAALGHRSYYSFRSRYAVLQKQEFRIPGQFNKDGSPKKRKVQLVVAHRDTDHLSRNVARLASVIRKEDCLDLPPKTYSERDVELTAEQLRIYRDLKAYATAELESGGWATTTEVITQLLRLHQVVCGHIRADDGSWEAIPSNRPQELMEVLDEMDNRTIVWATYKWDIAVLREMIANSGRRVVVYDGDTSARDRDAAIHRFQDDSCPPWERADVFLGTQHAGGYGITLTAARGVIYYSNNYDLEKRLQSEDRPHRIGQKFSVPYVDLVARGTVDERIMQALRRKENLANLIMDGPARVRDLFGDV